jgi:hypothetical protein
MKNARVKLPFKIKTKKTVLNPIEFLQEKHLKRENSVQLDEGSSSSQNSNGEEMSDKEDSINYFSSKKVFKKKRRVEKISKYSCESDISNLLLKQELKTSSLPSLFIQKEFIQQEKVVVHDVHDQPSELGDSSDSDLKENKENTNDTITGDTITDILCDVSLRKEFIIYSKSNFEWLQEKNSYNECVFVKKFLIDEKRKSCLEDFYTSLMYFAYPGSKRAPPYVAELAKSLEISRKLPNKGKKEISKDFLQEELEEWKISFRSVYFMVRNGESRFFYYVNSEFSVLFSSQGEKDSLNAVLSNSTVGLRKALQIDGIEFTEKKKTCQKKIWPLEFDGVEQVHGLYDFLLKWTEPRSDKRSQSLPLLYSHTAFLNASLKSSKVIRSSKILSTDRDGYRMVIEGILFPEAIIKLLRIFKEKNEDFTVTAPVWDVTLGLQEAHGRECFKTVECTNGIYCIVK